MNGYSFSRSRARRRLAPYAAVALSLAIVAVAPRASAEETFEWPQFSTSEPIDKQFTFIHHHVYRERLYDPPRNVPVMEEKPELYGGPEEVVASMLSAVRHEDYDWWLGTWDETSRQRILASEEAMGVSREDRLEIWREKIGKSNATLVRWVETGQHVILTYRRPTAEGHSDEQAVAFKITGDGWAATLELNKDPVFLYAKTEQERVERRIRWRSEDAE